jgi:4-amino-4-deoxy-L-arabinose transferase-like glycosyltransferase
MTVATSRRAPGAYQPSGAVSRLPLAPLAIGALTLAVFGLRISQIDQSLFGDELWTYQQIHNHSLGAMFRAIHPGAENAPPLFFVLAWITSKLGDPSVWIRLPSVVLGTATVPVIYALGRQAVGTSAGIIAAAAFGLAPFSAYYGTEARPYVTMAFFVVVSTFALVRAVRSRSVGWWVLYVLAASAAAYSHYTAVFALVIQGAWSLWASRDRLRPVLAASAAIVLLYVPWLAHLKSKELGVIGFLEPLNWHNVWHDLVQATVGYQLASASVIPSVPGLIAVITVALVGLVALVLRHRAAEAAASDCAASSEPTPGKLPLLTALALATPVGVLLYSLLATDIWDSRDLYASVPYGALVLGALVAAIPAKPRALAILVVLGTLLTGTIRALTPAYTRPPFRVAAHYLDRVAGPQDPVVVYPSYGSLDDVITVQFRRRHTVVKGVPSQWPAIPRGGAGYVLLDDSLARVAHVPVPSPPGYTLRAKRHYGGFVSFTLLIYRRTAIGAS